VNDFGEVAVGTFRTYLMAAALGIAGLASAPAHANLIVGCSGQAGCSMNLVTVTNNTVLDYGPATFLDNGPDDQAA